MRLCSPRTFRTVTGLPARAAAALVVVGSLLAPGRASAQGNRAEHWGVIVTVTPGWKLAGDLEEALFEENETGSIEGSEFTIGIAHGRTLGGDWGVSFVRKPWKDGSGVTSVEQRCVSSTVCFTERESTLTDNMLLKGVKVHWSPSIVTFAERVQVGVTVAGGIASTSGQVIKTTDSFNVVNFNPQTQQATLVPVHTTETLEAKDELFDKFPLLDLMVHANVILAPGLKLRIAGGMNLPAWTATIGVVYLFGAR